MIGHTYHQYKDWNFNFIKTWDQYKISREKNEDQREIKEMQLEFFINYHSHIHPKP